MIDDLVMRLRAGVHTSEDEDALRNEAADRIADLESRLREAKSLLLQAHDQIFRLHDNGDVTARNLITKIRLGLSGTTTGGQDE